MNIIELNTTLWEEKNLTELSPSCENNPTIGPNDTTKEIKTSVIGSLCSDIGKIRSGIYKIVNKLNGKYYVGSASYLKARRSQHWSELRHNKHFNHHLQNAWNKYKDSSFEFITIELVTLEKLAIIEQLYLDRAKLERDKCYNSIFTTGRIPSSKLKIKQPESKSFPVVPRNHTPEAKQKMRAAKLGKRLSPEHRNNIIKSLLGHKRMVGKHYSQETCIKRSIRFRGNKNPRYDHTIYSFYNEKTQETFSGERFNFILKYNLRDGDVCSVIKGNRKRVMGWILIPNI